MTSNSWRTFGMLGAWLIAGGAAAQAVPASLEIAVVHDFGLSHGESWGTVAVALAPGGWRVGGPGGAPATEAQLRSVLRTLAAIEVGGRCAGWVSGPTAYPCGFSVRGVDMAGAVQEHYAAIAVDQQSVASGRGRNALEVPAEMHASAPRSPQPDEERFVAVRMPLAYLGDKSQTYGGTLRFEIRAVSNSIVPSSFDRSSGLVILRAKLSGERS